MPKNPPITEELAARPIAYFIRDLGLAVAEANKELAKVPGNDLVYTIPEAEVELNIAISASREQKVGVEGGFNLMGFSVNASYAGTFGFSEQASSRIRIKLRAVPRAAAATNTSTTPPK